MSNFFCAFFFWSSGLSRRLFFVCSLFLFAQPQKITTNTTNNNNNPPKKKQWYKPGGFSYHEGDAADPRMAAAAAKRGVRLTSRSRPLRPEDWKGGRFRHVVCMDQDNVRAVEEAVRYWKAAGLLEEKDGGAGAAAPPPRVSLMTDWAPEKSEARRLGKVPDPYYGGPQGFEKVLDLLDEAAEGLLDAVLAEEKEGAAA